MLRDTVISTVRDAVAGKPVTTETGFANLAKHGVMVNASGAAVLRDAVDGLYREMATARTSDDPDRRASVLLLCFTVATALNATG